MHQPELCTQEVGATKDDSMLQLLLFVDLAIVSSVDLGFLV